MNFLLAIQHREPSQTVVSANGVVNKSILPVAPCAKNHASLRVSVDDSVSPTWRYDYFFTRTSRDSETASRIIFGALLGIDDGAPLPYLE